VSLHSHAAVSNDVALSVFSDWVHLAMTSLWVGGLVQFLVAIPVVARLARPVAPKLGQVVAYFSNFARAAVVGLIVTGVYATWHQVNTVEALTTTFYGQLLSIKLVLALLLVAIAGVNLVWTHRRLLAGQAVWVGRLRGLVGVEVVLAFGILLAVGAMTAVNPARNEILQREIAAVIPPTPEPQPVHLSQSIDDLTIHFTAMPGWVGNSTFTVQLVNEDETPVTNATLIRMRFEHQTEDLGESELQIRPDAEVPDGVYFIEGANLSTVGEWRVRMTIQRPEQFDSVVDFTFNVIASPAPPPAPAVDVNAVPPYRTATFLVVGALALLAGVAFLATQRFRAWQGAGLLASVLVVLGITFLVSGLMT
jgi:copper transport protein